MAYTKTSKLSKQNKTNRMSSLVLALIVPVFENSVPSEARTAMTSVIWTMIIRHSETSVAVANLFTLGFKG